jgi:hypothetical protein
MRTIEELLDVDGPRHCFWLDENECESAAHPDWFRVCFVFEGEPGYRPTGGGDIAPWYWHRETCRAKNAGLGLSESDVTAIVCSSMFAAA